MSSRKLYQQHFQELYFNIIKRTITKLGNKKQGNKFYNMTDPKAWNKVSDISMTLLV